MGFDIECIIDIHTYPGEYFCPVCRTLVYPNEALQSQCTHLYCKPCLAHVANSTRACPYDGYLVTEADSKPLAESDKALAENIGKVKVRCLYHRSGCTWEGPLSESTAHCSGCAFGNSPVICNRCGIQIVHRQVHEHAHSCPGVYQSQQATEGMQDAASSGTGAATAGTDQNQAAAQSGVPTSQSQNSQGTAASTVPVQDPNLQANANSQAAVAAPASLPTPDQWYQSQYQQYYQQYAGYDPYQQYYPYHQQVTQHYQQQQPYVQGQHPPQVYPQTQPQTQAQGQAQPPAQSQHQQQPQSGPLPQLQSQSQPQVQVQLQGQPQGQVPSQGQPQALVPSQPQGQSHAHVQAVNPQHQSHAQVNPQQQLHSAMQPPAQVPSQVYPPAHVNPPPQPQSYPHVQAYHQPLPTHPPPQGPVQMPQYQQPPPQIHHPQASQLPPATSIHPQPPLQPNSQTQPQTHIQSHLQSQAQLRPPLPNQPTVPVTQPQSQSSSANAVTGHHSYPQPHPPQQMPLMPPQQPTMIPHPTNGPLPPMHGQVAQAQPPLVRPTATHLPIPNQQQGFLPSQAQVPGQQQRLYPHPQQPGQAPVQLRPAQPFQQPVPQQYMLQQPFAGPGPGQLNQHGHFVQQQSQHRPQVPPAVMPQNSQAFVQFPQSVNTATGIQPQQSQPHGGKLMMPNQGIQPQPFPQSAAGFGAAAQMRPGMLGSNETSVNQGFGQSANNQPQVPLQQKSIMQNDVFDKIGAARDSGTSSQKIAEKDSNIHAGESYEVKPSEANVNYDQHTVAEESIKPRQNGTLAKNADGKMHAADDGSDVPITDGTVKKEDGHTSLETGGKLFETTNRDGKDATKDAPKEAADGVLQSSAGADKGSNPVSLSSLQGSDGSAKNNDGKSNSKAAMTSAQQRSTVPSMFQSMPSSGAPPHAQAPGPLPTSIRPQGFGHFPYPGQQLNPIEHMQRPNDVLIGGVPGPGSVIPFGKGPGHFGPSPRSFESQPGPQGPLLGPVPPGSVDLRDGIMGRAPTNAPEAHFGPNRSVNPVEAEMFQNQRVNRPDGNQLDSRIPERGPFGLPPRSETNPLPMNTGTGLDSSNLGPRDGRFKASSGNHLNPFPLDHASRTLDSAPRGSQYDTGLKLDSAAAGPPSRFLPPYQPPGGLQSIDGGERELSTGLRDDDRRRDFAPPRPDFGSYPGFGQHHVEHSTTRSPDGEYHGIRPHPFDGPSGVPRGRLGFDDIDGREVRPFFEGSRPFNMPPNSGNNPYEGKFPNLPPHPRGGEFDGPRNLRFGENLPHGPPHNRPRGDFFGPEALPGHLRRGEFFGPQNLGSNFNVDEPPSVGAFPGYGRMGEFSGPGNFSHHPHLNESIGSSKSNPPRPGEPGFRSSYSLHGFPNDGPYAGDMGTYDKSRKRKAVSMGWCRICKVDCETVDGLDMHSQTREHQKMAMDMVRSIKQQNKKKQKTSGDHFGREETSKKRNAAIEGRGHKI